MLFILKLKHVGILLVGFETASFISITSSDYHRTAVFRPLPSIYDGTLYRALKMPFYSYLYFCILIKTYILVFWGLMK